MSVPFPPVMSSVVEISPTPTVMSSVVEISLRLAACAKRRIYEISPCASLSRDDKGGRHIEDSVKLTLLRVKWEFTRSKVPLYDG